MRQKYFENLETLRGGQGQVRENCKYMPKHLKSRFAVIVVPAIHPDDAWPMVRNMHNVARSSTLERSAEV